MSLLRAVSLFLPASVEHVPNPLLYRYAEGALSGELYKVVRNHVEKCHLCSRVVSNPQMTIDYDDRTDEKTD